MKMDMNRFQDEHLDLLIRLAFQMEEAQAVQQLMDEPVPEMTAREKTAAQSALEKAFAAANLHKKQERKTKQTQIVRKTFTRLAVAMLCIVVLAALALPITFTASAEFRARVMRLFAQENKQRGEIYFGLTEHPEEIYSVPVDWPGEYFPTYIPEGYAVYSFDPAFALVEYRDEKEHFIRFNESDKKPDLQTNVSTETNGDIVIDGSNATLMETMLPDNSRSVFVLWQKGEKWLSVQTCCLGREETLKIAQSIKAVSSPYAVYYELSVLEKTASENPLIPEGWTQKYFPTYLPEGFVLCDFDPLFPEAEYRDNQKRRLYFSEYDENTQGLVGTDGATVTEVDVQGHTATVVDGTALDGETRAITIVWSAGDKMLVVNTYDVSLEEALKVVRSVQPVDKTE